MRVKSLTSMIKGGYDMKVYCVMEQDYYKHTGDEPDALCSIWLSKEQAEIVAKSLNEESAPYKYYVREEEVH